MRPAYELDLCFIAGLARVTLRPKHAQYTIDRVNRVSARSIILDGDFIAQVREFSESTDGLFRYKVTTQAGGKGGRRHRWFKSEGEAVDCLEAWYCRRFSWAGTTWNGEPAPC
jgi:hypothetical protein